MGEDGKVEVEQANVDHHGDAQEIDTSQEGVEEELRLQGREVNIRTCICAHTQTHAASHTHTHTQTHTHQVQGCVSKELPEVTDVQQSDTAQPNESSVLHSSGENSNRYRYSKKLPHRLSAILPQ